MKKIAVIHDLSGLGKCSLTAAIPVISAMGVQACPLPTAILSNQTGYGSYFWDDYTDRMELIMDEWKNTLKKGKNLLCSITLICKKDKISLKSFLNAYMRCVKIFIRKSPSTGW